jgi:Ulp1 family protease
MIRAKSTQSGRKIDCKKEKHREFAKQATASSGYKASSRHRPEVYTATSTSTSTTSPFHSTTQRATSAQLRVRGFGVMGIDRAHSPAIAAAAAI